MRIKGRLAASSTANVCIPELSAIPPSRARVRIGMAAKPRARLKAPA